GGDSRVATATAAVDVALKVIDGLASWVDNQSQACKAAAYGMAFGQCCGRVQRPRQDEGYLSAFAIIKPAVSNAGGRAWGYGQALRGFVADHYVRAYASAYKKTLHQPPDEHAAEAWGRANVKGTAEGMRESSSLLGGDAGQSAGDVYLDISVTDLTLRAVAYGLGATASSAATWLIEESVDGARVFYSAGTLTHSGSLTVEGDIPGNYFTPTYDPSSDTWGVSLAPYQQSVYLGHLEPGESRNFVIDGTGQMTAGDAGSIVPEPASLALLVLGLVARLGRRR
ncbi:MAG: PEP-CTERM sorting domain-containing protein, partial [Planctomycetota bacterium]